MSSTTVHSNNKTKTSKTSIVASGIYLTPNSLEVPKDANRVNENIVAYIGESGMDIQVGNAIVNEKGEMQLENGSIKMLSEKSMKAIMENRKEKQVMKEKLAEKEQVSR